MVNTGPDQYLPIDHYRVLGYNTEGLPELTIQRSGDAKEVMADFVKNLGLFIDLLKKSIDEFTGVGPSEKKSKPPVLTEVEVGLINTWMLEQSGNSNYLSDQMARPFVIHDASFCRIPDSPNWFSSVQDIMGWLVIYGHYCYKPDTLYDNFRDLETRSRNVLGSAKTSSSIFLGSLMAMVKQFNNALAVHGAEGFMELNLTSKSANGLYGITRAIAHSAKGMNGWFDRFVVAHHAFLAAILEELKETLESATTMLEQVENGEFFTYHLILFPKLLDFVKYFQPKSLAA